MTRQPFAVLAPDATDDEVDDFVAALTGESKRYSANQPRKPDGKFGSGGAPTAGETDGRTPVAGIADYQSRHPDVGLDLDGAKPAPTAKFLDGVDELQDQYPGVKIDSIGLSEKSSTVEVARTENYGPDGSGLLLSRVYYDKRASYTDPDHVGGAKGWHPEGTGDARGTAAHEFGHAWNNSLSRAAQRDYEAVTSGHATPEQSARIGRIREATAYVTKNRNSGYGKLSPNESAAEWFAEAHLRPSRRTTVFKGMIDQISSDYGLSR